MIYRLVLHGGTVLAPWEFVGPPPLTYNRSSSIVEAAGDIYTCQLDLITARYL